MRNEAKLKDKVVVVTGGGRGIGEAAAILLARAGAAVVAAARTETQILETVERISQEKGRAIGFPADVSDWTAVQRLEEETARAFSPADIAVVNASVIDPVGDTWEVAPEEWARNLNINLTGAFYTARAFLPEMVARKSGILIFVSTGAALHPVPGWSAYCAAKAGLELFARTVAAEIDQRKLPIRVHILYPGVVATSMQEKIRQVPAEQFPSVDKYKSYHKKGLLRPPEEPATLIWWLATPMAAEFHGQSVNIDDPATRKRAAADLGVSTF
jgi:NAD(P)-dependent dehydrogenase (short-subunit alcohol dehydrogenase family)